MTDFYYPALGGISEHVDGQARALTDLGHEVTVITGHHLHKPRARDDDQPPPAPNFELVRMGSIIPVYLPGWGNNAQTQHVIGPWLGQRLGRFFRERGFDVVHVHAPYNPPMPAWAIQHTPYDALSVATFHSVFPPTTGMDILAAWTRPLIERLDGRICVSEACIGSLTPYFPFAYHVIPNGIDAELFSPAADPVPELVSGDHQNVVFVGRFDPRNGLDTMIAAYRLLRRDRGDSVRLVVVGDGPLRGLYERQAGELNSTIHWAGPAEPVAAQPPGVRLGVLHAVQPRLIRHGAARGDELRPAGGRQPHLGVPAGDARRRARLHDRAGRLGRTVRRGHRRAARRPRAARPDGRSRTP